MKHIIPILLLLLSTLSVAAQKKNDFDKLAVPYKNQCKYTMFCLDCGEQKARFAGDIEWYIQSKLDKKKLENIYGAIVIDVYVDSTGQPCVKSYSNNSQNHYQDILDLDIDKTINTMPFWTPAVMNGHKMPSSVMLVIYCHVIDKPVVSIEYMNMGAIKLNKQKK